MFKKQPTIINVNAPTRTEYVTTTMHEHRAPTDKSVELLKEMEDAARDKIIESIKVGDSTFECVVHTMKDYASDDTVMRAVFILNGKRETAEYRFRPKRESHPADAWLGLRDEVAKVIATRMIDGALKANN